MACGLGWVVWMCLAVLCFSLLLASVDGCFGLPMVCAVVGLGVCVGFVLFLVVWLVF